MGSIMGMVYPQNVSQLRQNNEKDHVISALDSSVLFYQELYCENNINNKIILARKNNMHHIEDYDFPLHEDLLIESLKYLQFHHVLQVYICTQHKKNNKIYDLLLKKITRNYIVDRFNMYVWSIRHNDWLAESIENEISLFKHYNKLNNFLFLFIRHINDIDIVQYLLLELLHKNFCIMLMFFIYIHQYINININIEEMEKYYSFYDKMFDSIFMVTGCKANIVRFLYVHRACYVERCNLIIDENKNKNKNKLDINIYNTIFSNIKNILPYLTFLTYLDLRSTCKKMHSLMPILSKMQCFEHFKSLLADITNISYKYYLDSIVDERFVFPRFITNIVKHISLVKKGQKKKDDLSNIFPDDWQPGNTILISDMDNAIRTIFCFRNAVYNKVESTIANILRWILYAGTDLFFVLLKNYCKQRLDSETYNKIIADVLQFSIHDINYDYYADDKKNEYSPFEKRKKRKQTDMIKYLQEEVDF